MKKTDTITHEGELFEKFSFETPEIKRYKFIDCTFSQCLLSEHSFAECSFTDCVFNDCDLSLLRVKGSFFSRVEINRCKAIGIHWFDAGDPFSVRFTDSIISYSSFFGKNIRKAKFKNCVAKETDFSECTLIEADLGGSDLTAARFSGTDLTQADLRGAHGYYISFAENKTAQARFSLPEELGLLDQFDIIVE